MINVLSSKLVSKCVTYNLVILSERQRERDRDRERERDRVPPLRVLSGWLLGS